MKPLKNINSIIIILFMTLSFNSHSYNNENSIWPDFNSEIRVIRDYARFLQVYWNESEFTKPEDHNDDDFLYVVHEIDGSLNSGTHKFAKINSRDPQRLINNYRISSSVISNNHRTTFTGQFALILNVPSTNYGPMMPYDMASHQTNSYSDSAVYFQNILLGNFHNSYNFKQFLKPRILIQNTKPNKWNEVLIMGRNDFYQTKVSVLGAIIQCRNFKDFYTKYLNLNNINNLNKKSILFDDKNYNLLYSCINKKPIPNDLKRFNSQLNEMSSVTEVNYNLTELESFGRLSNASKRLLYLTNLILYREENNNFVFILTQK